MELSYATAALRRRCLGDHDPDLPEARHRALLAVLADLRAAPTLADAPLRVTITGDGDEVSIAVRGTPLQITGTIGHLRSVLPSDFPIGSTGRLQLLAIGLPLQDRKVHP